MKVKPWVRWDVTPALTLNYIQSHKQVSLGNCVNCTVDRFWIDGTRAIGIQLGGSAALGNRAKDSRIINSLLTRVASQGIALVNVGTRLILVPL